MNQVVEVVHANSSISKTFVEVETVFVQTVWVAVAVVSWVAVEVWVMVAIVRWVSIVHQLRGEEEGKLDAKGMKFSTRGKRVLTYRLLSRSAWL